MDLSVCIPVFNSDVKKLVIALHEQIVRDNLSVEIVVLDDASALDLEKQNRDAIEKLSNIRYFSLPKNVGRSAIRNRFVDHAVGDFLLFIDGDSELTSPNFLANYTKTLSASPIDLLYGGSIYSDDAPHRNYFLRWKYSILRESRSAQERAIIIYGFKTNNFIIKKSIFCDFPFDERIEGYGHEDTLFGFVLFKNNVVLKHVENPVLNGLLDTNAVFLSKTEEAIKNLWFIHTKIRSEDAFVKHVRLLSAYYKIRQLKLLPLVMFGHFLLGKLNLRLLKSGYFNLRMYDFYKLALICKIAIKKDK